MLHDVLIIGGGPAGLTAGIYTSRAGLKSLMLAGEIWGGQLMLTTRVENFPGFAKGILGPDLMRAMRRQAEKFGLKIVEKQATKVDFHSPTRFKVWAGDKGFEAKAVIVAAGAETVWLGVPGERKLIGRGVSTCAACDGAFFKDKKVAVVGGGDTAMEEALTLTKFASEVTVVHRRDKLRASKIMQERAFKNRKIKFFWNSEVVEVIGENKVEGVSLKSTVNGQRSKKAIDGLFVAIGYRPATKIFQGQLELDEKGYLVKAKKMALEYPTMTSVKGVFRAGDVHDSHYKQAITAAGFGCMAALDAERWLEQNN